MSTTLVSDRAQQIVQQFHTAVSTRDNELLNSLVADIGKERVAELGRYYTKALSGDVKASGAFKNSAFNIAEHSIKLETPPSPTVKAGMAESFLLGAQKALQDLSRTAELRQKEALHAFDPTEQRRLDVQTLQNTQAVEDALYERKTKEHPIARAAGSVAPYVSSGAALGSRFLPNVAAGAYLGAMQPGVDPYKGAALGALTTGAVTGVSTPILKGGRAATRKLADIRRASTPEFEQASEISKQLGFRDYTKSPQISHTQETLRRGLMAHLGTEDLSAKGLANTKEAVGREIGAHYRQSNIPLPPSLNDDLDSILQITKAEAGELPTPMATKASQIQDVVMDVGNPDRGAALHSIRQRIGDLASPNLPKPVRDGYRALQQYIDDLALTGLPGGDQAILRGLQKRFGMLSEMSKKRVVDSGTGEVNLPKLQALAEDSFHMRMNPELYDLAQAARASAETEALSIGQSYPAVTEAIARSRSYAARPLLERFTQPIRTIAGTPVPQSGQALVGAGSFGLLPFSMYGQQ